jgi:hypothetical protein
VADMQGTTREVANIHWWTRQYPWSAVAAATVLGFVVAASVLAPSHHRAQPDLAVIRPGARPSWMTSLCEMVRSLLLSIILDALHPTGQRPGQTHVDPARAKSS